MMTKQSPHSQMRIQNMVFMLLFLTLMGLLTWLSTRYNLQTDWTANARKSLSETSQKVLQTLDGEVRVTAYATENKILRTQIRDFIDRYAHYKADLTLQFINPDLEPDTVLNLDIRVNGELIIQFDNRQENVRELTESGITNTLQRLVRTRQHWIVFLSGHGERSPLDQKNHDLGQFGIHLKNTGYKIHTHNPATDSNIPDNAVLLVIAGPRTEFLPGETAEIHRYLSNGGNLLWLRDPGQHSSSDLLANFLGIRFLPGIVVDAKSQSLGISDPSFAVIADYPDHPSTENFSSATLFPLAGGIELKNTVTFESTPILLSSRNSWTETGPIKGQIAFDPNSAEKQGPIMLGVALTHDRLAPDESSTQQQRIVVIADADFLANTYLANGGNLNLGFKIIQWLISDRDFISIPIKHAPDQDLELSHTAIAIISLSFLIGLPVLLIGTGTFIWIKRRRL